MSETKVPPIAPRPPICWRKILATAAVALLPLWAGVFLLHDRVAKPWITLARGKEHPHLDTGLWLALIVAVALAVLLGLNRGAGTPLRLRLRPTTAKVGTAVILWMLTPVSIWGFLIFPLVPFGFIALVKNPQLGLLLAHVLWASSLFVISAITCAGLPRFWLRLPVVIFFWLAIVVGNALIFGYSRGGL